MAHCAYLWFVSLSMYACLSKKERTLLKNEIKQYSFLALYAESRKVKLSYNIYRMFGLEMSAKILKLYVELKKKNWIKTGRNINNG